VQLLLGENENEGQLHFAELVPRRDRRRADRDAARADQAARAAARRQARPPEAAAARLDRRRKDWLRVHGDLDAPPLPLPPDLRRELWIGSQLNLTDPTGEQIRWRVRAMSADGRAEIAGASWYAAVVPLGDGTHRYTVVGTDRAALRARRTFTLGWLQSELERAGVVRGVSLCTLLRMIRDVNNGDPYCRRCQHHHPSRSAWNHRGPDATLETGDIGYGVALELAGAIVRHQWRTPAQIARHCEPWEIGDSGYPTATYQIVGRDRAGRAVEGGRLPPALIVQYAMLRDVAAAACDDTLPFVRAPYGSTAARRAQQHAQAPP
jgi:hypothetical protein